MDSESFVRLMQTVADGWNENDAAKAANCFAEDASYIEPPDKQAYQGRAALFDFFGGNDDPPPRMEMVWHHLIFDEGAQIGCGEYTFQGQGRYHGVVMVKLVDGLIATWREYQYASDLEWEEFVARSAF